MMFKLLPPWVVVFSTSTIVLAQEGPKEQEVRPTVCVEGTTPEPVRSRSDKNPTLLTAVTSSKGGDLENVVVVSETPNGSLAVRIVNVRQMILRGSNDKNLTLAPRDLVYIPRPRLLPLPDDHLKEVVREAAIMLAVKLWGTEGEVRLLVYQVLTGPKVDDRLGAAMKLGVLGEKARVAVPALVESTTNSELEPRVRYEAVTALGMIGDKRAIEPLRHLTDSGDKQLRERALAALKQIKEQESHEGNTPR